MEISISPPPPPPTSPPPAYARGSSPSQAPPPIPPPHIQDPSKGFMSKSVARKPLPVPPKNDTNEPYIQFTPSSAVMVHDPVGDPPMEASSAVVEDHGSQISPPNSRSPSGASFQEPEPSIEPKRLSPAPHSLPLRTVPANVLSKTPPSDRQGTGSLPLDLGPDAQKDSVSQEQSQGTTIPSSHASSDSLSQPSESFQPLQYHHQHLEGDKARNREKRASHFTNISSISDPALNDDRLRADQHLAPVRNSYGGRSIGRPNSAISSGSDVGARGRTRSPQLSPNSYARAPSAHSTGSPDNRPLSFVDLLNVPYPQPPPAPAGHLDNAQLRNAVGNNASLLSTKQTLEMYRANVKKTNDSAIQYEFAVFMISAAQEASLDEDSSVSEKSTGSSSADLIREARQILQRLSDRSYPFAQYYLADGYASGLFNKGKEDYDKAFPLFVAASKHGHAEAGYRAALCYEFGWGCRVDAAKAVQFYRQAASKNHPGAMSRLGKACLLGDMGLGKRYREGIKWLKRAAESADFQYNAAPYELGSLHETGYGDDVFKDESYAAQLFTKSADLGHPEANYRLGDAYEHGKLSCPKDPALSIHFYTGAAQRGHPLAMMALCAWYMVGAEPVLEKDENEAYEWARRAAEEGLAKAQYALGYFTEMGIGCRRDALEANVWYVRAADQGDERAKHRIAAIRAAATGADPVTAALPKDGSKLKPSGSSGKLSSDGEKTRSKRFGIF